MLRRVLGLGRQVLLLPPLAKGMGKRSNSSGPAFYGVQRGRRTGVFTSWAECESVTRGYEGAVFKRFSSRDDAASFAGASSGYKRTDDDAAPPPTSSKRARVDDMVFRSTRSGSGGKTIVAYCDGSSLGNGKTGARAGWGVYWDDEKYHGLNEARRLPGPLQTNNRAELMALIRAIQLCPDKDAQLVIFTDSKYAMDCVENWITNWRKRGWKSSTGTDVQNRDLIRRLDREMAGCKLRPRLEYVKGHAGIHGNEMVDRMAKHGAALPDELETPDIEPPPSDEEPEPKPLIRATTKSPFSRAVVQTQLQAQAEPRVKQETKATEGSKVEVKQEKKTDPLPTSTSDAEFQIHPDDLLSAEELRELENSS